MNVRLVAYRPATPTATSDSTYQLDLQEAPNVSLNFQFADIKEPDKRKASYSQTFKLPFTQKNNAFFQTWFNVNLETPVFNSRKRFAAVLYVGTVPQFDGVIQLKGVYLKAGYYDVVLMSHSADLFTKIGSKKLKDVFKQFSNTGVFTGYSTDLNHTFTASNVSNSWNGASTAFVNYPAGSSLRDADAGVQKVMYPLSFTKAEAFYNSNKEFLNLDQSEVNSIGNSAAQEIMTDILQLRPAIQIKELFKRIIAKAGFSYTSSFIDGSYFGKLFMTTCNTKTTPGPNQLFGAGAVDGVVTVGNSESFKTYYYPDYTNYYFVEPEWSLIEADTVSPIDSTLYSTPYDPSNLWNETSNTFLRASDNMVEMNIAFVVKYSNIQGISATSSNPLDGTGWSVAGTSGAGGNDILWEIEVRDLGGNLLAWFEQWVPMAYDPTLSTTNYQEVNFNIDLLSVPIGTKCKFYTRPRYFCQLFPNLASTIELGAKRCLMNYDTNTNTFESICDPADYLYDGLYNRISLSWLGEDQNQYDNAVDVPAGIDETLTQKGFLKDIMQRFNLVILSDPNNPENLLIEPYNDFIGSGELKDWSSKLDTSKEIFVSDTTSMQKSRVLYTDLEDNDLWNKSIKEEAPAYNVYGKMDIRETNNEFATGEMKNSPVFSPYINEKIFSGNNEDAPTNLPNVAAQYEYTYKLVEGGMYENTLEATKPKLYYYSGTPTPISGTDTGINFHHINAFNGVVTAHNFSTYPLCSPFELTTDSDTGIATITASTRTLHWNLNGPLATELTCFNYNYGSEIISKSLYFTYWYAYLNGLYDTEARLMECHLNLNEVDIFNFSFADEIFIKDTYWRILNISNYQVGAKASTKVTLLKVDQGYDSTCFGCDYVPGSINGSNTVFGFWYVWCPTDDPDCVPNITSAGGYSGLLVTSDCCECFGGTPFEAYTNADGLMPCMVNSGSLPYQIESIFAPRNLLSKGTTKSLISGKISGLNKPIITGNATRKYDQPIVPYFGNDIVVKYKNSKSGEPLLSGESHRVVLSGHTNGNTRGYAYINGDSRQRKIPIPLNSSIIIRLKGTATVIGGTSSSYPIGTVEGFAWYTAFKNVEGQITQLSTAGGQQEFSIREGANPTTCTLHISTLNNGNVDFGLDDSQTDTRRLWVLTVDLDVNQIFNMGQNYDDVYAQYQNYSFIELQNNERLIWN